MGAYDWLDLSTREWQEFLRVEANHLNDDNEALKRECEEYRLKCAYIESLERQVVLLQKTLDVMNKNKVLVRKVKKYGRG